MSTINVWVVSVDPYEESGYILGVYATEETAKSAKTELILQNFEDSVDMSRWYINITKHELDK